MMSNPYSIIQTNGQIYRDARGEIYQDDNGRYWQIQRLDDGRRVYYNGTQWIDVQTQRPVVGANRQQAQQTRQHQTTRQQAPQQQHAPRNQHNSQELAVLREHHASLAKSVRNLEHHVHNHDVVTDETIQALGKGILEIEDKLQKLQKHVDEMALRANGWINSQTGRIRKQN
jgi:cobyric acid synthase